MSSQDSGIKRFTEQLQAAVDWMEAMGVRTESTRFTQYLVQLRDVISDPERVARTDDPQFELILEAFDSGAELVSVHREFRTIQSDEFIARLSAFAKGTYLQRDEDPKTSSNRARNQGFELYFGAQLSKAGFSVEFPGTSDLQLASPLYRFECKRPQSEKKLKANLKDARNQLGRLSDSDQSINVIALSVGKLVHGGSKFLHVGSQEQLNATIDEMLARLRDKNQATWRQESFSHVAGIWLHYSGMVAFSKGPMFARGTYDRVIVLEDGRREDLVAGLKVLAQEIEKNTGFDEF